MEFISTENVNEEKKNPEYSNDPVSPVFNIQAPEEVLGLLNESPVHRTSPPSYSKRFITNWFKIFKVMLGFGMPIMLLVEYYQQIQQKEDSEADPLYFAIAAGFLSGIAQSLGLRGETNDNQIAKAFLDKLEEYRHCSYMIGMALNIAVAVCRLSKIDPKNAFDRATEYGTIVAVSVITGLLYFKNLGRRATEILSYSNFAARKVTLRERATGRIACSSLQTPSR